MSTSLESNHFVYGLNRSGYGLGDPSLDRVSLAFTKEGSTSYSGNSIRWVMEPFGLTIKSSVLFKIKEMTSTAIARSQVQTTSSSFLKK